MGYTSTIFGSELTLHENEILDQAYRIKFHNVAIVSDHYDRKKQPPSSDLERLSFFDGTLLAFISPDQVDIKEYPQAGTIKGSVDKFEYVNQFYVGHGDIFCIYFLILPTEYFPKKFIVPNEPHFAARVGEQIRITWWFKEKFEVKIEIEKNPKKYLKFDFIDSPTFSEKHPGALASYREVQNLTAKVLGEIARP
ncbi:hypothetical protein A2V82_13280 [candidate division KSB1 bacterium RBG_16_48_16]|nr:MAG: hypothetical protein A2V82_13280 [candidate division KSB1 bacterium RBG_16_48_16]